MRTYIDGNLDKDIQKMEARKVKVAVNGSVCKDYQLEVKRARAVFLKNGNLKITGKVVSKKRLWDAAVKCIITIENGDREVIHSNILDLCFSSTYAIFDWEISEGQIKQYVLETDEIETVGIAPHITYG